MSTHWTLNTAGDPLGVFQTFIRALFDAAALDALLIPLRMDVPAVLEPHIVEETELLYEADPFAPLMTLNAAKLAVRFQQGHPQKRFGVVMRPCELRALDELAASEAVDTSRILLVGVDCVGTFPANEIEWRGAIDHLTRETLQFARQGGVDVRRFREACQMCTEPMPASADLTIDFLGLPARKVMTITAPDDHTAASLNLAGITDGPADPAYVEQHQAMRATLYERRGRARARLVNSLSTDLVFDVDTLIDHLADCAPCQECLNTCPIYGTSVSGEGLSRKTVIRWLTACAGCGMCEQTCPEHLSLSRILTRIHDQLTNTLSTSLI